jgi:protein-tyrosine phosphatase
MANFRIVPAPGLSGCPVRALSRALTATSANVDRPLPAGPPTMPESSLMGEISWPGPRRRHGGVDEIPLRDGPGRLWLCGKHFVAPDPEQTLDSVGATTVVCLSEHAELIYRYPSYVDWLRRNEPAKAVWHPIPDLDAPDVEAAAALLDELRRRLTLGHGLLVHCGAGIGRSGTIAAGLLVTMGTPVAEAIATVAAHRPMAGPQVDAQLDLLAALARI